MLFSVAFALALARQIPGVNSLPSAAPQQLAEGENTAAHQKLQQARVRFPHELGLGFRPGGAARASDDAGHAADRTTNQAPETNALLLLRAGKFPEASEALARLRRVDRAGAAAVVTAYLKGNSLPRRNEGSAEPVRASLPTLADELRLARTLVGAQEQDLAQIVLEEAATSFPDSSDAHGEFGLLLSIQSQYQKATQELERAVQIEPNSFKYSLGLAEAQLSSKHNFTALKFLQSVQSRFQSLPEYQYILALAYYECYRYPEAITGFQAVAKVEPGMDRVPFLIGNCYMALGDLQKAQEFYRQAIAMKPQEPTYRAALGKMLRMQGRIDEAIHVLGEELQLAPLDSQSRYHLALCYEAQGNFREAQLLLEQVVRQKPEMLAAHVALARMYYHDSDRVKAGREDEIVTRLRARGESEPSESEPGPPLFTPQN